MSNIIQIIMAGVMCFAVLILLWQAKGRLLKKAWHCGDEKKISVVVAVNGSAPQLESTVSTLLWMRRNGDLPARILLVDDGMDLDTAFAARLLADNREGVYLCNPDQLEFFILRSGNYDGHNY